MLLAAAFSAAVLAQTPPPQRSQTEQVAQTRQQGQGVQKTDSHARDSGPDMGLIGYLGEFEDAADGIDPIGLSERPDLAQPKDDKDGHQP